MSFDLLQKQFIDAGLTPLDLHDPMLEKVFCHASCSLSTGGLAQNYERLEFLGDRVLSLAIADLLYQMFPNSPEGGLAKRHALLVSAETLNDIALELQIDPLIKMRGNTTNPSIRSDVIEALIGFVYRKKGLEEAQLLIKHFWENRAISMTQAPIDPRSQLQEHTMKQHKPPPNYQLVRQSGSDHQPEFLFSVTALGHTAYGNGRSKQIAKTEAAFHLIALLKGKA